MSGCKFLYFCDVDIIMIDQGYEEGYAADPQYAYGYASAPYGYRPMMAPRPFIPGMPINAPPGAYVPAVII